MTDIENLLNNEEKNTLNNLLFGEDKKGGLYVTLPIWTNLSDVAKDCICCMLMLRRNQNITELDKNELYTLYKTILENIEKEHPQMETSNDIFTQEAFEKFINTYPQIIDVKGRYTTMTNEFVLTRETLNELETFSAKYEQLRNFVDFVNSFVWQEIIEGYEGETIERLGCLTEMLSDVVHIRDTNLETIIKKIKPFA